MLEEPTLACGNRPSLYLYMECSPSASKQCHTRSTRNTSKPLAWVKDDLQLHVLSPITALPPVLVPTNYQHNGPMMRPSLSEDSSLPDNVILPPCDPPHIFPGETHTHTHFYSLSPLLLFCVYVVVHDLIIALSETPPPAYHPPDDASSSRIADSPLGVASSYSGGIYCLIY